MIIIEVGENKFKISGHAQAAAYGQDLVCCSVSTIWFSLEEWVRERGSEEIRLDGDSAYLSETAGEGARAIFEYVIETLYKIAYYAGDYVRVKKV